MRYWKVRTDFERDKRELAQKRNARNNAELGSITQKYLAYFSEENPRKRAILLREFTPTGRDDEAGMPTDDDTVPPSPSAAAAQRRRATAGASHLARAFGRKSR